MLQGGEVYSIAYKQLIDTICDLYKKELTIYPDDLFQRACDSLNIKINDFYKEDIIYIGLYCCQIILNDDIYLKAVSGNTKTQAYENAVREFINLCLSKKDIPFRFSQYNPEAFYMELQESIESIELSNNVRISMKELIDGERNSGHLSKINSINYNNAKKTLANRNLKLSEKYRTTKDNSVCCSIFVNDVLLLQQDNGKDEKEALENTVTEFFYSYEIMPREIPNGVSFPNGDIGFDDILRTLGKLFREEKGKVTGPVNYWNIIQNCAKTLNYDLSVKSGKVKINDVTLVDIEETNEYVGNIKAGKKLVEMLSTVPFVTRFNCPSRSRKSQSLEDNRKRSSLTSQLPTNYKPEVMNFPKMTKIYNEVERVELLKTIAIDSNKEFMKDQRQKIWNVINQTFLKHSCTVEVKYVDKDMQTECILIFQGFDLVSGFAVGRTAAREEAALNFQSKYLPS